MSNSIVAENLLRGTPRSEWDITTASRSIEGFTTDMSVNRGGVVEFKIDTDAQAYKLEIYRLGYYQGNGARLVDTISISGTPHDQPAPITDATGLVDAGNWAVSATWTVPQDAVSGVYIAKLVRQDGISGENHIPFIIRNDDKPSDVLFKTADETWQAYNPWGDNNYYQYDDVAVSYNRPFTTRTDESRPTPWNFVFGVEHAAIMWLEQNGFDVSYVAGVDTARDGAGLLDHQAILSVGHDEYWSGEQRSNVEAARDAGVNLLFWGGNDVYWRSRWADSIDGSNTAYRTLVTYKSTLFNRPDDPLTWTGTWRDDDFFGGQPENALTGTLFQVDSTPLQQIYVPYEMSNFRIWNNTSIADLEPDQRGSLGPYLGYEWNDDVDNGFRPAGLVPLSLTTNDVQKYVYDEGASVGAGTSTHSLTLYRTESGALVFSAGSVMWAWGLESEHDPSPFGELPPASRDVQQAMVNLLADMGIQPESLQTDLSHAAASSDVSVPMSAFVSTGTVASGARMQIAGTATDAGGGTVAVVEVSADGGATWHRANGRENWTYTWDVPLETGTYSILTRAVDDSINIQKNFSLGNFVAVGFSTASYLAANPDVAAAGVDPYRHYLIDGWLEGRDPSATFDTERYLRHNQDVADAGLNPLTHFMEHGLAEGRPRYAAIGDSIEANGFDRSYYLMTYRDVAAAGVDPLAHFEQYGWVEGRNPNAYFDTGRYLERNSDVAAENLNPLDHYNDHGWIEGRAASAEFSSAGYLEVNTDVAEAVVNPLWHFLSYGSLELRTVLGDLV